MSDPLTLLLGERVLRPPPQDGPPLAEEATGQGSPWLETASLAGPGRLVGLYFSAQWCPPCRAFTARLAELYRTLRAQDQEHDRVHRFEVVLVSSDAEVRGWDEQRRSMPWGALPFEHRQRKFSLCRKFKVTTIPTLILLDSCNTHVRTKNGVATVTEDPHGLEFPWAPKPFAQTIAGPLIRPSGEMTDYGVLEDAHIGLYFSANWCPPCKAFTPMLCETYRRVCEAGKKFEIIFVSSDRSEESFQQYFGDMPWLAVPYADTQRRESLGKLYSIQGHCWKYICLPLPIFSGIPSLILLDPAGRLITSTGRVALLDDRLGLRFPWEPAALSQLSPTNAELLNQEPALVLFVDSNEDEELGPVRQMLQPIAEKVVAESKANGEEQPLHFFYAGEDDMADSIRDFTSLPDCAPLLAILDVPARAKFVKDAEELSPSVVHEFLQDYLQGRLEAEPI